MGADIAGLFRAATTIALAGSRPFWHRRGMRWWSSIPVLGALAFVAGGSCGDGFTCDCVPCGFAITVVVVDEDLAAFGGDWTIEASLDGVPVDASNCDPQNRQGDNTCGLGLDTGTYQLVLRTPTAEKSFVARFAGRAGQNCCDCILGETIQVVAP
jgi:hypothetical protein